SPKQLALPGPDAQDLDLMFGAALSAPDHAGLRPWRFIVFSEEQREPLADLFEAEKLRRDPLAPRADVLRAREHATRSPALLAFVVAPRVDGLVPVREQWLAAGAALGNLLNAAHQLGFGAIVLSGDRCFDAPLQAALGLAPSEFLAGFVSLGSILAAPPPRRPEALDAVRAAWVPGATASGTSGTPPARSVDDQPAGHAG
ncbi:MAG TPA: nitroreductase, partial [Pseudorhodoferax sp.]|nr:nitroreductase [Pseudorhodoferax sp.]